MTTVKLSDIIAPSFYDLHKDIKADRHTHYWLKGGRGSTKSSFASTEIPLGLVPIRVGMIPVTVFINVFLSTCPHTRGDDPIVKVAVTVTVFLSPYAWG